MSIIALIYIIGIITVILGMFVEIETELYPEIPFEIKLFISGVSIFIPFSTYILIYMYMQKLLFKNNFKKPRKENEIY